MELIFSACHPSCRSQICLWRPMLLGPWVLGQYGVPLGLPVRGFRLGLRPLSPFWSFFPRRGGSCVGSSLASVKGTVLLQIINSVSSRDQRIMHLVRRMTLVACRQHFSFSARHIPGHRNAAPDAVSYLHFHFHFHFQEFHWILPSAGPLPSVLPPFLLHEFLFMC